MRESWFSGVFLRDYWKYWLKNNDGAILLNYNAVKLGQSEKSIGAGLNLSIFILNYFCSNQIISGLIRLWTVFVLKFIN